MEYHKIHSLFKRDEKGRMLIGEYSKPEFEYLRSNLWVFDEKVDGTNIRLMWDGNKITIGGKTDNAQIPTFLYSRLNELIDGKGYGLIFDRPATIYGEGYGARIQKGGGNYNPDGVDFVVFDIRIGDIWLKRVDVCDIAGKLGLAIIPSIGEGTLDDLVNKTSQGLISTWGDFQAEGIVARPTVGIRGRMGDRIITKLKTKDFIRATYKDELARI
jgi:ATP-dependent RNA circularization protein (DNA/RNA ligase family)